MFLQHSCVYHKMRFKGLNGKACKMMMSHLSSLTHSFPSFSTTPSYIHCEKKVVNQKLHLNLISSYILHYLPQRFWFHRLRRKWEQISVGIERVNKQGWYDIKLRLFNFYFDINFQCFLFLFLNGWANGRRIDIVFRN